MSSDPYAQQESAPGIEHIDGLDGFTPTLAQNRSHAEDRVQEICEPAIRAMGRLRNDSNVKGWLFRLLPNIWLNELTQSRKAPAVIDVAADEKAVNLIDENAKNPHDLSRGKPEWRHVPTAIRKLAEETREVILLREWEGSSYQQMAKVLDCLVGKVRSRLARARSKLRDSLCSLLPNNYCCAGTEATE
jgi:RNA polymerase sigma-70 factor, ECF subfamily